MVPEGKYLCIYVNTYKENQYIFMHTECVILA